MENLEPEHKRKLDPEELKQLVGAGSAVGIGQSAFANCLNPPGLVVRVQVPNMDKWGGLRREGHLV